MSHLSSLSTSMVKGSLKSTFTLWCSQIAPSGYCKGAGGEYHFPISVVLESSASVLVMVSAVWGKGVSFSGGAADGRTPIPSQLTCSICRQTHALHGERRRRDNLIDSGHVSWSVFCKCLLGLGANRHENGKKFFSEEGTTLPQQAQKELDLLVMGQGFQQGEVPI